MNSGHLRMHRGKTVLAVILSILISFSGCSNQTNHIFEVVCGELGIGGQYRYSVINAPEHLEANAYYPTNNRQYGASIELFIWEGKLYFYNRFDETHPETYGKLSTVENGSIVSICEMGSLYAFQGGYAYFAYRTEAAQHSRELMCYDLSMGEIRELIKTDAFSWHDVYFTEDGTCYIPADSKATEHYVVSCGRVEGLTGQQEAYQLGSNLFAIENNDLVCYDESGTSTIVRDDIGGLDSAACIIPCDYGLIVYNIEGSKLLYFIPEESCELVDLFHFTATASEAAVAVYGDTVYVSVMRYTDIGSFTFVPYENDSLPGTYRISLKDYSVEKLNNTFYDGLYIYDDTGMYACADGCVYKLDFNGSLIMTVLA